MRPDQLLPLLETEIAKQSFGESPDSLYEPLRYIMKLGGKRMRPLLTCLSYGLYEKDVARVVPYAIAVEVFHNFTLMHDDIMDKAPLRRGKKTVHEKWNTSTAILAGDVMLVKAYELFAHLDAKSLKQVLPLFNRTASEVCEGQQWDMEFETKARVSEQEYLEMIRLKTAVLLGFSLELGAILGGAPMKDRKALYDFGVNLGIGFQLKDDLLDVYADRKKFGKQVGGDIISNKKTFLLIHALQQAKGKHKAELRQWLSAKKFNKVQKVKAVTRLYDALHVKEATEEKIEYYFQRAFISLNALSKTELAPGLIAFAKGIAARQK